MTVPTPLLNRIQFSSMLLVLVLEKNHNPTFSAVLSPSVLFLLTTGVTSGEH